MAVDGAKPEFKLRRSDSITSLNSYFSFKPNVANSGEQEPHTLAESTHQIKLEQIFLRLCMNCSHLLEKKYNSFRDKMVKPTFVSHYEVYFNNNKKKQLKKFSKTFIDLRNCALVSMSQNDSIQFTLKWPNH